MSSCRRTLELKSFTLLGRSSPSVTSPSLQDFGNSSGVGGLGNSPLMDAWADTFEACGSSTSLDALGTITSLDVRHLGILLSSFYGGKINHKNEKQIVWDCNSSCIFFHVLGTVHYFHRRRGRGKRRAVHMVFIQAKRGGGWYDF